MVVDKEEIAIAIVKDYESEPRLHKTERRKRCHRDAGKTRWANRRPSGIEGRENSGEYSGRLEVEYEKGNLNEVVTEYPVRLDLTAPTSSMLRLKRAEPTSRRSSRWPGERAVGVQARAWGGCTGRSG